MLLSALQDPKQVLRLKRTLLAIAGGVVHTFLCWLFLQWNFFRATEREFFYLFGLFWLVHLAFPLLILTGFNQRFKDPSLTLMQMAWATICIMISVYYIYELRMVVLMYYLLVMIFGAFRLRLGQFLIIDGLAIASYGLVIAFILHNQMEVVNSRVELIQWIGFSVVMTSFALLGADLSALRHSHRKQSTLLAQALDHIKLLAVTDELTGLWNRRYAIQFLQAQRAPGRARSLRLRGGLHRPGSLQGGQRPFRPSGGRSGAAKGGPGDGQVHLREIDCLARFGGEEFLVVLVQANQTAALTVAKRLLERVRGLEFGGGAGRPAGHPEHGSGGVPARRNRGPALAAGRQRRVSGQEPGPQPTYPGRALEAKSPPRQAGKPRLAPLRAGRIVECRDLWQARAC